MVIDQAKAKSSYREDRTTEKPLRSVVKTISWRVVGTIDTIAISWLLTREVETALAIGSGAGDEDDPLFWA